MDFSATTFILEIVNFLVLLWLLQRFLYVPVMTAISQRQTLTDEQVDRASNRAKEAEDLKTQYEGRLSEWEKEKQKLRAQLDAELSEEKKRMLAKARAEAEAERKKAQALIERDRQSESERCEMAAVDLAAEFTQKLLTQLASPELEKSICKIFLADLAGVEKDSAIAVGAGADRDSTAIQVTTAYRLDEDLRRKVKKTLFDLAGGDSSCEFREDPELIAGIRVTTEGRVLEVSLKDAVGFFQELKHHAG